MHEGRAFRERKKRSVWFRELVDAVGSDLGWSIGTCGKDGQCVPVSDAQPTLRLRSMVLGGTDV